ncbi:MAG: helix-turn-helix domain-containing protein [Cytophagales bacterium]|nr:helix-turn-helix domain-containing protein [Cytophagales bacterium]
MGYSIIEPSAFLTPFIKQYWVMDGNLKDGASHMQRIVPSGFLEWTFYLGDPPAYLRDGKEERSFAMISGQQYGFYDISVTGHLELFSIMFTPFGARYLFNFPISEFSDQSIPAELIYKSLNDEVASGLFEAKTPEEKRKVVEKSFLKILNRTTFGNLERVIFIFHRINESKGNVDITKLASHACWSRKQFERNFYDHVGITPKKYLRIVRFQHALHVKELRPDISLTQLAVTCNYYDQSHMINDFRYLAGISPKEYFAACTPYSDYFN